jgi:hypothetical protein
MPEPTPVPPFSRKLPADVAERIRRTAAPQPTCCPRGWLLEAC